MTVEFGMILSIPEIRLCLHVLGCEQWDDLPLMDTGEPAEQRLLNAFLHLIKEGRFLSAEGGYQMAPDLCRQMLYIGQADCSYHLYGKKRILAFLYEKDHQIVVIAPDRGKRESCRVFSLSNVTAADVVDWFAGLTHEADLELRQVEKTAAEKGEYDSEKLAFFLGMSMEEGGTE